MPCFFLWLCALALIAHSAWALEPTDAGVLADSGAPVRYYTHAAPAATDAAAVLVVVHGYERDPAGMLSAWVRVVAGWGIDVRLVAPDFDERHYPDFQRLGRHGGRADLALLAILDDLAARYPRMPPRVHLFGYSGGGQFVHRFAMAHPDRVVRYLSAASGWYTMPEPAVAYPYGIGIEDTLAGLVLAGPRFYRVPGCVVVGADDTQSDENLRRNRLLDEQQGDDRLERGQRWSIAVNERARGLGLPPPVRLHVLPGVGHAFSDSLARFGLDRVTRACLFPTGAVP